MPRRPDTFDSLRVALAILRRIPRHGKTTAKDLQKQLAAAGMVRTERSVQRLLEHLVHEVGISCDDTSKPYGYSWKADTFGPWAPMLSAQESLLLTLAQKQLRHLLPPNLTGAMSPFFDQARRNLHEDNAKLEQQWLHKVRVVPETQPLLPPAVRKGVLEEVSKALYGNCWLTIRYANAQGGRTEGMVMPLGLAQQGPRLYLVCRFKDYHDDRTLAIQRIQSAEASRMTFERPADFDLAKFEADGRFGFGEGKRINLRFRIAKSVGYFLAESKLAEDQTLREVGEDYIVAATVVETEQLRWWLRTFGKAVRDVLPKRLDPHLA